MEQVASKWNTRLYSDKHSFVFDYGESLIGLLNPQKGERILDLGCGSGQLTCEIHNLVGGDVVGIDKSQEMIESARANFPLIQFQVGDASDFHFEEKFDAIFSNATLHWVVAYKGAIASMYLNLKIGGRMVVEFGGKGNVLSIVGHLRKSLMERGYEAQSQLDLWYFPSIGEYTSELEAAGFDVTFAQWYDRPTELADEATGIKDWLTMFGGAFFEGVGEKDVEEIENEVQESLKSKLFKNGKWHADYKRIRVIANKN